jgi:hypothetical protein
MHLILLEVILEHNLLFHNLVDKKQQKTNFGFGFAKLNVNEEE